MTLSLAGFSSHFLLFVTFGSTTFGHKFIWNTEVSHTDSLDTIIHEQQTQYTHGTGTSYDCSHNIIRLSGKGQLRGTFHLDNDASSCPKQLQWVDLVSH